MSSTKICLFIVAVLNLIVSTVSAQNLKITGRVTDNGGNPVEGVTVRIKGGHTGTKTDNTGGFTLEAKGTDELQLTAVGFAPLEVPVGGRAQIAIQLQSTTQELSAFVTVGTRTAGRAKTETPVPVDVIRLGPASQPTAKTDLTDVLNMVAPSVNYNKQSGSDGADQVDLATLRGLGPDQTLVLVNGKRRHQTAFVAVFGTRGRGNSGTDLNAIPESAIDRVEILRDGASAQYGSDAIAGVINLVLKKSVKELTVNAGWSGYYDPKFNAWYGRDLKQYQYSHAIDGNALTIGANYGLPLGKNGGFINFSFNMIKQGKTFRQAIDTNISHKDGLPIGPYRRAHGDGSKTNTAAMFNMEVPIAHSKSTFYAFGGYSYKSSDVFAYTRSYAAHPERFPDDGRGNLLYDPNIMYTVPVPGGGTDTLYDPHEQTHILDLSGALGVRGALGKGWSWDISNVTGRNDFHYYGDKTFNASMGADSPNHFDDGGFSLLQNTTDVTFTKPVSGVGAGLNLAFGAEYRFENYKIYAGSDASWKNYDPDSIKAIGAQGFPGYRPTDVVNANRNVVGAFAEAEFDVTNAWLLDGAIRAEHYSDFGFTSNYKLATRYKVSSNFNLRGSISTGFRAPSLAQINYSSQFTNVQGGKFSEVKIAPNYSPITKAAGIPTLKQEKSLNASLGFSWKPATNFTVTVDGYLVKVKDRVVLSGQFSADDESLDPSFTNALKSLKIDNAQFFANAVNTTNTGVDIVLDYNKRFAGEQHFRALLAANIQHVSLDKINVPAKLSVDDVHRQTFYSTREQQFLKAAAPPEKVNLSLEYGIKKFNVGTHLNYYGKVKLYGYGWDGDLAGTGINPIVPLDATGEDVPELFVYSGKLVTDLYVSYAFSKHFTWFLGADNMFNVHPDFAAVPGAKLAAYDGETGGAWDAVQMGFNGRRLFTRVAFRF